MPAYYPALFAAVREAIAAAWPECVPSIIWHRTELLSVPFESRVDAMRLPLAVIDYQLLPSPLWGLQNDAELGPVTIWRVQERDDDLDSLVAKLELLRTYVRENGLNYPASGAQLREYPLLEFSIPPDLNQYFLSTQKPFVAGAVMLEEVLVGEMPEAP